MGNGKDFNYMFYIEDENGDSVNESAPAEEFVDIMSDSSMKNAKGARSKHAKKLSDRFAWWKNSKGWQKGLIISCAAIVLVVAILIGVVLTAFDYNYNAITSDPVELGFENVLDENIVNVALFGIDTRDPDSFKGLSDSIMILSLNTNTKKVKIISIMRDSLVPITYNGKTKYNKINSAYQKGGPELAIKTLNTVFNLDISEYATVNFFGMADIIEAVGGIDAELTKAEVGKYDGTQKNLNGCIYEICQQLGLNPKDYYIFESGVQHLNGVQAVAYSRIRYVANIWGTNNDYGRTDRQRYVMEQLFNKALTIEKTKYAKLAKALIPCSETSLSYKEIMGLAFDILLDSPTFAQTRVPQQEYQMRQPNAGVGSVVYYDLDFVSKLIHAFIYDDITPEQYIEKNGIEKNDWYGAMFGYSGGSGSGGSGSGNNSDTSSDISSDGEDGTGSDTSSEGSSSDESSSEDTTDSSDGSDTSSDGDSSENQGDEGDSGEGDTSGDSSNTDQESGGNNGDDDPTPTPPESSTETPPSSDTQSPAE